MIDQGKENADATPEVATHGPEVQRLLLRLLHRDRRPSDGGNLSGGPCFGSVAAAATQIAQVARVLTQSARDASSSGAPLTSLASPGAAFTEAAVASLLAALSWPGAPVVRLAAAEALQLLANAALLRPPLLIEQARGAQRALLHAQQLAEEQEAQRLQRQEEAPDRQGFRVRLLVSEESAQPITVSLVAPTEPDRPNSTVDENTLAGQPNASAHSVIGTVFSGQSDGSGTLGHGRESALPQLLRPQQLARIAAAAADASSDVDPAVAAAAMQLLRHLSAPAALLAVDPAAAEDLEEAAWRIEVSAFILVEPS